MRTAGDAKCASDPHVVSALRYGHKSRAVHRLAPADEVLGLPLRTYPDRIAFDRVLGPREDPGDPATAIAATV
ncbi:MAG: hypothetical protein F4Z31_22265 [Gemmatimonadetes bacterium]|nr:hypothetical protein [Gemmatimonadota bacterium]MYB07793.1 hypothetical protein [Gemmatimonadota bacterium]MYE93950.1 hypothetical protein [Gemmatimonadota bacterium]MYG24315.1 hypothetical protein [Gemmatimonadota bacterium]MYJ10680.1 hypothetical protein [Gemmatimonadota bacterium]